MNNPTCIVPFTNISLEPNGDVGCCRQKGSNFTFGNLRKQTFLEIWQSEKFKKWRSDFLDGQKSYCKEEIDQTKCHLCEENKKIKLRSNSFTIENPPILKLNANFSGKCNLRCQMCDIWKDTSSYYNNEEFWQNARESLFRNLQEIDMLSGEPFIQAETFRLIEEMIKINSDCKWSFTTNLHWKMNKYIKNHLDQIKIKNFIVSIDGITKNTYEKIRYPGKLAFVLSNLEKIIEYRNTRKNFNLWWNFLVQKDNWNELPQALIIMRSKNIKPFPTFLNKPSNLSLLSLSAKKRKDIMLFFINEINLSDFPGVLRILRPLLNSLSSNIQKKAWLKISDAAIKD